MSIKQLESKSKTQISKTRIFTESDRKQAAERLERIEMHLIQPSVYINDRDLEYLDKMIKAFGIAASCLSKLTAIRKFRNLYPGMAFSTAKGIVEDAEDLFAPMTRRSREMTLAVIAKRADEVYKQSMADGNLKQANSANDLALKIEMARKEEEKENVWDQLQMPDIQFTTDPKALSEAEDLQFTEVDQEEE